MAGQMFLISTTDLLSGRDDKVARMLDSVAAFRSRQPEVAVRHLFLFQNADKAPVPAVPDWLEVETCDGLVPLSVARNRLMAKLDLASADEDAIFVIPDDDCWYPEGSLDFMRRLIVDSDSIDMAFCDYDVDPRSPQPDAKPADASLQEAISHASSTTLFLRARLAAAIGAFGEDLGLGTPLGGGEDTDYAIRAWHLARRKVYVRANLVGHRAASPEFRARYFPGALAVLRDSRRRSLAARVAFYRKLAVGVVEFLQGRIAAKDFLAKRVTPVYRA